MKKSSSRQQPSDYWPYRILIHILLYTTMLQLVSTATHHDFKRHLSNPSSGAATRICRSVCSRVNHECSATCYPPFGTAHTTFSTTWIRDGGSYNVKKDDSEKYQCINRCFEQDSNTYMIPNSCQQQDDDDEGPTSAGATKQTRVKGSDNEQEAIELSTLTTEQRCKFQAYRNSTVCKFEDDAPDIAKKVFDANNLKLTLCMAEAVMSGHRGFYTRPTTKRFLNQHEILRSVTEFETSFPGKRSIQNANGSPTNFPVRRKRTKRSLGKNTQLNRARRSTKKISKRQASRNSRGKKELCVTETNVESPVRATHRATGNLVDIYFYKGYSQWFEMGKCKQTQPLVNVDIPGFSNIHCGMTMTAHKAYVIIDPAKTKDVHKFQGCGTIKTKNTNQKYQICHDWVYLDSHCKLFYS